MKSKYNKYNEQETTDLKLVVGLYRSYINLNKQTQKKLSEYKLTLAQFGVLEALYHLGDLKINDIIEKTLSTSGNITVVIKNLEKEELIRRYSNPTDSRVCMISLTEKGQEKISTIFPEHLIQLDDTLKNLTIEEKKQLIKLLKKLNDIEDNKGE